MKAVAEARAEIERLWGPTRKPKFGPRAKQSAREVARAAIRLADAQGLDALTMRSLAAEFGLSPMGLYTYFPSKFELVELMVDEVYAGLTFSYEPADGWRGRLAEVADANWRLVMQHPWLADVEGHRPVLGPNVISKYDQELRAIDGLGLSDVEMDLVLATVLSFVRGAARGKLDAASATRRSGLSDAAWWQARQPLLAAVLGDQFPLAQRVGAAVGETNNAPGDPDLGFRFGLDRLLDGVAALLGEPAHGERVRPGAAGAKPASAGRAGSGS